MSWYEKSMRACFNLAIYKPTNYRPYLNTPPSASSSPARQTPRPQKEESLALVHRLMNKCYNMALIKP